MIAFTGDPTLQPTIIGDFLNAIMQKRAPLVTGEQAAYVTKVVEAGYLSAAQMQEVMLDR